MRNDHILTSLKVIASLKEGQKISVRHGLMKIDPNPSGFLRWISGDSRQVSLLHLTLVIQEALLAAMYKELEEAAKGLETLKVTYGDDIAYVASIDILINKIREP
jgi:hypothetical protein